jgi:hypothetical protein
MTIRKVMRRLFIFPLAVALLFGQTPSDANKQPAAKPNNSSVKPRVIVVTKSPEQEQAEKLAVVNGVLSRYTRARTWLDGLRAKYPNCVGNDVGEDEPHVLGRHYADVEYNLRKSAIPIADALIDDFAYYQDNASSTSTLGLNTLVVEAQHLDLILDGLQAEDRKWLRHHAQDRVAPGVVIVVGK